MIRALAVGSGYDNGNSGHHLVGRSVGEIPRFDDFEIGLHERLLLHESALLVLGILILGVFAQIAVALGELDALDVGGHILIDELEVFRFSDREAAVAGEAAVLLLLLDLDDARGEFGSDARHSDDDRMVGRMIPGDGSLEALEEHDSGGFIKPAKNLLKPLYIGKEAADHILHLENLAALTAFAERDGMGKNRDELRKLGPVLEHLVFADYERRKRRGCFRTAHKLGDRLSARALGAEERNDLRNGGEAELIE